jgi:Na+-transporting methylmalonyl-CoA/oxaloacetate decarboxylase gamma subunit
MDNLIILGLQAAGYGLAGVFIVLILFYVMTKGMMVFFENREKNSSGSNEPSKS